MKRENDTNSFYSLRRHKHPSKMALLIAAIFLCTAWIYFGVMIWYPFKPLVIHKPPEILNEGKMVSQGYDLIYSVSYTKYTNKPAKVSRQLINSYAYPITPYFSNIPAGSRTVRKELPIPMWVDPGMYRLFITYEYQVSSFPIRNVVVTTWSEEFEVIDKDRWLNFVPK